MFPGYISVYRDELENVHLYFFKGISNEDTPIYRNLDFDSIKVTYDKTVYPDGAIDLKFSSNIDAISCSLINIATNTQHKIVINNF